ncbi:MAG: sodium:alanine symporter family protein [Myxococcales bacterium]|nr:sodium:alanine symporter family protein [Myxococcales bacterium]USN50030.1 MAG: sodium:alanine symporter family protein [Myxococcales bacterium]
MLNSIKEAITLGLLFPIIIVVGGYLTVRLRLVQLLKLKQAFLLLSTKEKKGSISSFGAMAAILGGNLGTGNISGVAVALMTGGPGALLWMWVMAILAASTKYVGCFLGVHFQKQNKEHEWVGGPMFYLKYGIHSKILASLFCIFTISSALTVGNLVQVHALTLPIKDLQLSPLGFALILSALVGGVIFGGLKRFSHVVSALVPLMAFAYIGTCLIVLVFFRSNINSAIQLIITSAFGTTPAAGGFLGFTILQAMRSGFDRGLFATDCGLGLAPMLHGAVRDISKSHDNRHTQALISVLSPIIVMVVCTMTGLILITTGAINATHLPSTTMCMEAFRIGFGSSYAGHIVSITLFFFAFTTILTWNFCANRAVEFLVGKKWVNSFQVIFILLIPFGAYVHDQNIWLLADFSTNLMFLCNMVGVVALSSFVFRNDK